jgi:hypothetical protein
MFLKDKVLPKHIDEFIINKKYINKIGCLFAKDFLSNLYIYGPSGSGKYSLFIKNLEKIANKKIYVFPKTIVLNNQWSLLKETTIMSSEYHFEINLSKYSNNKNNLFSLIDALTDSKEVNGEFPVKIIIIRNIHTANTEFIKYIKQKTEQLTDYVRFVLIGKTNSNNIKILNGFFGLRMETPKKTDIIKVVKTFSKKKIKDDDINKLVDDLNGNLSNIFANVEMLLLTNFYKSRIEITSDKIFKLLIDKKISNLYEIRDLIYDYQVHNQSMSNLLKEILNLLLTSNKLDQNKKIKLVKIISNTDLNLQKSYKEIIHLEHGIFSIFKLIHTNLD